MENIILEAILQVITAVNMKMTACWEIAPCNLVEVDRIFRDTYCAHDHGDERRILSSYSPQWKAEISLLIWF
jgi:hypothetical protein